MLESGETPPLAEAELLALVRASGVATPTSMWPGFPTGMFADAVAGAATAESVPTTVAAVRTRKEGSSDQDVELRRGQRTF